jgi:hypothetical protein
LRLVILATDEIVRRYMTYDSLFSFYEDGVKEVVKQAVLDSGRRKPYRLDDRESEVHWMQSLAGRVIREWEHELDKHFNLDDSLQDHEMNDLKRYRTERDVIQLVVEQIEEDVDRLIQTFTGERRYRVRRLDPLMGHGEWLQNDLVVEIGQIQEA